MKRNRLLIGFMLLMVLILFSNAHLSAKGSPALNLPDLPTQTGGQVVYATDFDGLALGQTESFPGAANQGGWFSELAFPPAYGEIQDSQAQFGQAFHQFTSTSVPKLATTIDKRFINPPNLTIHPLITLEVDFYAHTSDLNAMNAYDAVLVIFDGTHPGFEVLGFSLYGGNGIPKAESGVIVSLNAFNEVNNNEPFSVSIGQNLAWDTWHHLTLVADHENDRYVSLTIDGETADLSAYALPRSETEGGGWERGQLMQDIQLRLAPHNEYDDETDDDVYWDNLRITVEGGNQVHLPLVVR